MVEVVNFHFIIDLLLENKLWSFNRFWSGRATLTVLSVVKVLNCSIKVWPALQVISLLIHIHLFSTARYVQAAKAKKKFKKNCSLVFSCCRSSQPLINQITNCGKFYLCGIWPSCWTSGFCHLTAILPFCLV